MSFWETVGKVGSKVVEGTVETVKREKGRIDEADERISKYSGKLSDQEVLRRYKNTTNRYDRIAYGNELKARGYGKED